MSKAGGFYRTQAWKHCSKNYKAYVGGLCEICLERGEYVPGEIVHHKIHLDEKNVSNPQIALDFKNLQLICRKCHAEQHPEIYKTKRRRFSVDEFGRVVPL